MLTNFNAFPQLWHINICSPSTVNWETMDGGFTLASSSWCNIIVHWQEDNPWQECTQFQLCLTLLLPILKAPAQCTHNMLHNTHSTHSSEAILLPMVQCYITHIGIWYEERPLNPFPGKSERTPRLENYELFIYGDIYYITNEFCKNVQKMAAPEPRLWNAFSCKFLLLSVYFYCTWYIKNYIRTTIHICILKHSLLCLSTSCCQQADQISSKMPMTLNRLRWSTLHE